MEIIYTFHWPINRVEQMKGAGGATGNRDVYDCLQLISFTTDSILTQTHTRSRSALRC